MSGRTESIPVVKVDKLSRTVVERYGSMREAVEKNGLSNGTVSKHCNSRMLTEGDFYFRREDDFDPDEDFTGKRNCPVVLYDTWDDAILWYPSATKVADDLYLSKMTVCGALNGRVKRLLRRYQARRMPVRMTIPAKRMPSILNQNRKAV